MNNSSLGLMTYCSLAKELMEIKKFNTPIKIFNFYSTITMAREKRGKKGYECEGEKIGKKKKKGK